jgi:hypothetical protein
MIEVFYDINDEDSLAEYEDRTHKYYKWLNEFVGKEDSKWSWHPVHSGVIFEEVEDAVAFKIRFEV